MLFHDDTEPPEFSSHIEFSAEDKRDMLVMGLSLLLLLILALVGLQCELHRLQGWIAYLRS